MLTPLIPPPNNATNARTLPIRVLDIQPDTPLAIRITLNAPKLRYQSGEYLTLSVNIDNTIHQRAYSLYTTQNDPYPAILIKSVPDGIVSNYLLQHLKAGDVLQVGLPKGNFTLEHVTIVHNPTEYVLIAGGSGITPLLSLAKTLAEQAQGKAQPRPIKLYYGCRRLSEILLLDHLLALPKQVDVRLIVEEAPPKPPSKAVQALLHPIYGKLDADMQAALLNDADNQVKTTHKTTQYMLCGPSAMRAASMQVLEAMNVPKNHIQYECFVSDPLGEAGETQKYTVQIALNNHLYDVLVEKESILAAGLRAGLPMPYSCQNGICTTCRGLVERGEVKAGEETGLSQEEYDEGYVLCCKALPASDDVLIRMA